MTDIREAVLNRRPLGNQFTQVEYTRWSLEPKQLASVVPVAQVPFYQRINDIRMELQRPDSLIHMDLMVCQPCPLTLRLTNMFVYSCMIRYLVASNYHFRTVRCSIASSTTTACGRVHLIMFHTRCSATSATALLQMLTGTISGLKARPTKKDSSSLSLAI